MRLRNAFTLVELLVVITIIAILAALLFPVFSHARAGARQTTCLSNFKQHSLAILMYVQDYDEMMPTSYYGAGQFQSPPDMVLWQFLQPYIKISRSTNALPTRRPTISVRHCSCRTLPRLRIRRYSETSIWRLRTTSASTGSNSVRSAQQTM